MRRANRITHWTWMVFVSISVFAGLAGFHTISIVSLWIWLAAYALDSLLYHLRGRPGRHEFPAKPVPGGMAPHLYFFLRWGLLSTALAAVLLFATSLAIGSLTLSWIALVSFAIVYIADFFVARKGRRKRRMEPPYTDVRIDAPDMLEKNLRAALPTLTKIDLHPPASGPEIELTFATPERADPESEAYIGREVEDRTGMPVLASRRRWR